MSSVAVQSPTKNAVKKVTPRKPKAAAPVTESVDANIVPVVAEAAPAPAKKSRAAPKKKTDAAVAAPVVATDANVPTAEAVSAPAAPKKPVSRKRAKPSEDEAEEGEVTSVPAPDADKKTKKVREIKPKVVYIEGYGDLEKAETERDFSEEEYKRWQEATALRAANQKFKDWARSKKAFYKNLKTLLQARKRKRQQKRVDNATTSENHFNRLTTTIPKAEYASLNNVWLSGHGFEGFISADVLDSEDKSQLSDGAYPTYTVYRAAVSNGARPLGIVSENRKKNHENNQLEYITNIEGNRVYVGIALPFQKLEASQFAILSGDRAFLGDADSETADAE